MFVLIKSYINPICLNLFSWTWGIFRYSPDARAEAPRWSCALCALGLFIYQSLDAIDGKQARRTNSSNPLGELFDHGCDSISTVFVALSACIAVQLGHYPGWMFFQVDYFSYYQFMFTLEWTRFYSSPFDRIKSFKITLNNLGLFFVWNFYLD